ncbi:MAG: hypothetical protein JWM27_998 [Gemmatimonadetes bacterium]|nr:hypothetical protein [Gemmatimonadota bacterium]
MRTRLSSSLTRVVRVLLPVMFVVAFGAGVVLAWVGGPPDVPDVPMAQKVMMTVWWAVVAGGVLWLRRALSDVWIEDDRLVVPAGGSEWLVPLSAVEAVSEFALSNPRAITLRVRLPSGELRPVRFLASADTFLSPFKPHPVVTFLRERIAAARADPVAAPAR